MTVVDRRVLNRPSNHHLRSSRRPDRGCLLRSALFSTVDGVAAAVAVGVAGGVVAGALACLVTAAVVYLLDGCAHRLSLSALDDAPKLALRGVVVVGVASMVGVPSASPIMRWAPDGAGLVVTALTFAALTAVGRGIGYNLLR